MWIDNASDIDILFYEPYADIIAEIAQNPEYKPLTIGVFGVWGAGKSTLLKLIEKKIPEEVANSKKKNICSFQIIDKSRIDWSSYCCQPGVRKSFAARSGHNR